MILILLYEYNSNILHILVYFVCRILVFLFLMALKSGSGKNSYVTHKSFNSRPTNADSNEHNVDFKKLNGSGKKLFSLIFEILF